jgi:signal transduction histidine kinase
MDSQGAAMAAHTTTSASTRASPRAQAAVDAAIATAAWQTERWLSRGRLIFYSAIWVRNLAIKDITLGRCLAYSPLLMGILFSLYVLYRLRQPPRGQALWILAASLDILAAYSALIGTVLWHGPDYQGFLWLPETSGVHIATMAAGLRLSPRAAIGGGIASAAGLITLTCIDAAMGVNDGTRAISMYAIFTVATTIVAAIIATSTRRLVLRASQVAVRAERAERGLGAVLADCHDARSLLTSVRVSLDGLARGLDRGAAVSPTVKVTEGIRDDLGQIEELVLGVNLRALEDLSTAEPPVPVPVVPVVTKVLRQVAERYPGVRSHASQDCVETAALVAGGESALQRVLLNLLSNACEGDGTTRPSAVAVSVLSVAVSASVLVRVEDDGPGLGTAKPGGLGVGLKVVRGISEASGGHVRFAAREGGGTLAEVRLPAAPA